MKLNHQTRTLEQGQIKIQHAVGLVTISWLGKIGAGISSIFGVRITTPVAMTTEVFFKNGKFAEVSSQESDTRVKIRLAKGDNWFGGRFCKKEDIPFELFLGKCIARKINKQGKQAAESPQPTKTAAVPKGAAAQVASL